MALITTAILTERIRRTLSAGYPSDLDRIKSEEIKFHVSSVANKLLKVEMYNTIYSIDGESIPDGAMIATYERVPLRKGGKLTSVADLPATPMMVPERQGVFSVYPHGEPENEFIPLPPGTFNIYMRDRLVSPLNRTMYTWDSGRVTIFQDLVGSGIEHVDMKLVIMDITKYGDNDPLPITPDIEAQIIAEVVALYSSISNTAREEGLQPPKQVRNG